MINLELYRIFYVVAQEKNITKASEVLNISQPAVTKHIKNLEYQLGSPLFIRTKKGVILNEYGEKIYLNVKNALTLLEQSEVEINNYINDNRGVIKIGISTTLAKLYLMKYIEKYHKLYPNIIFEIITDPTKELIKQMKSGLIDIIISKFPREVDMDLEYNKLGTTKYIFVANDKYKELKNKKIKIDDLIKYPMVLQKVPSNSRGSVERYFAKNNIKIEPKMNIGSSNLLIDFVSIGYGIGYSTKLYAQKYIDENKIFEIKVEPDTEKIDYGLIYLKNNILPVHITKFINFIKDDIIEEVM